jgi:drug/metabolite transporter (DMT)-like permease
VISALLGIIWLKEAHAPQKIVGSVLIALGVAFIGMSK